MAQTENNRIAESLQRRSRKAKGDKADTGNLLTLPDASTLPDGRELDDLSDKELAAALVELEIPDADKGNTRGANIATYRVFLADKFSDGGKGEVEFWRDLNAGFSDESKKED
jgi:hypothetical protein